MFPKDRDQVVLASGQDTGPANIGTGALKFSDTADTDIGGSGEDRPVPE
jgi:hypothetical protein